MESAAFHEHDHLVAAQARQFFRAIAADDNIAAEIAAFHFENLVTDRLNEHLATDPRWDPAGRNGTSALGDRWFVDFVAPAPPSVRAPTGISLLGDALGYRENRGHDDPFEFELELRPDTGEITRCTYRFGRPADFGRRAQPCARAGCWAYAFCFHTFGFSAGSFVQPDPAHATVLILPAAIFEDGFDDWLHWPPALRRQVARARQAGDVRAEELTTKYLQYFLTRRRKPADASAAP